MQQEVNDMPNRTIYVADADMPLYEAAQRVAGGSLSAAITEALRRFVAAHEGKTSEFEDVTVKVGAKVHTLKRFRGRLLAKGRVFARNETRKVAYDVYQTPKENFVVYVRDVPNWNFWSNYGGKSHTVRSLSKKSRDWDMDVDVNVDIDWSDWEDIASHWTNNESEYRLEVYASLEELEPNVPPEIYEAISRTFRSDSPDGVEDLDI